MKTLVRLVFFAATLLPGIAAFTLAQQYILPIRPETKKIPSDSLEIATTGCLKGRVFTATQPREDFLRRGPNVTGRSFRLNGPRAVIDVVKTHDGDLVEIVGLVRKNDLRDNCAGCALGNTRVVIGAPRSGYSDAVGSRPRSRRASRLWTPPPSACSTTAAPSTR